MNNEVCFCIPARIGSSRLKNKLLLDLNGDSCIRRTIIQILQTKYSKGVENIYVLTDSELIANEIADLPCQIIMTVDREYPNGTARIIGNLCKIDKRFKYIMNVQADEPFISPVNIDYLISKLDDFNYVNNTGLFYITLHEETNTDEYLRSTGSLKLVTDCNNNVLYYSRNIIPWNKKGELVDGYIYKTFTGLYLFKRGMLELLVNADGSIDNSLTPLQEMEDCEQLKILEKGWKIKSYSTIEYNEISLNTPEDYEYLKNNYK